MEKSASMGPVMLLGLGSLRVAAAVHSPASHNFHCTYAICLACLPPASEYCTCALLWAWGDMINTHYSTLPHLVWFCPLSWQSECFSLFWHRQIWVLLSLRLVPLASRVCFFTSIYMWFSFNSLLRWRGVGSLRSDLFTFESVAVLWFCKQMDILEMYVLLKTNCTMCAPQLVVMYSTICMSVSGRLLYLTCFWWAVVLNPFLVGYLTCFW